MSKRKSTKAESPLSREEIRQESGRRLRTVREMLRLQQNEVASACGVSSSRISENEAGTKSIGIDLLTNLRVRFNVNPLHILTGEGPVFLAPIGETGNARSVSEQLREALDAAQRYAVQFAPKTPAREEDDSDRPFSNVDRVEQTAEIYRVTSDQVKVIIAETLKQLKEE